MNLVKDLKPPYYAVIFTSIKNENDEYEAIADRMLDLVHQQSGFLGVESAQGEIGITISYWKDLISISNWKDNFEHQEAQKLGKEQFYKSFSVKICKVERAYSF